MIKIDDSYNPFDIILSIRVDKVKERTLSLMILFSQLEQDDLDYILENKLLDNERILTCFKLTSLDAVDQKYFALLDKNEVGCKALAHCFQLCFEKNINGFMSENAKFAIFNLFLSIHSKKLSPSSSNLSRHFRKITFNWFDESFQRKYKKYNMERTLGDK